MGENIIDDFIVICRSLGYYIPEYRSFDHEAIGSEQQFYTNTEEIALSLRYYKNENVHLKVNEKLMFKFNIEVARLRKWFNNYQDVADEFDVSPVEAFKLWNTPSLRMLGKSDIKLLGFDEGKCA